MPGGKKKAKPESAEKKKVKNKNIAVVSDALTFDDKFTRRLPIQELAVAASDGHKPLGVELGNHPLGAIIREVRKEGQAHALGLKPGDVIISIDDARVSSCHEAAQMMFAVQRAFSMAYYLAHDAETALLKKRQPPKLTVLMLQSNKGKPPPPGLGLKLSEHPLGLRIEDLPSDGHAVQAGLRVGDVIVTLSGRVILSIKDANDAINMAIRRARDGTSNLDYLEEPLLRVTYLPRRLATLELAIIHSVYASPSIDDKFDISRSSAGSAFSTHTVGFSDFSTASAFSAASAISAAEPTDVPLEIDDEPIPDINVTPLRGNDVRESSASFSMGSASFEPQEEEEDISTDNPSINIAYNTNVTQRDEGLLSVV